MKKISVILFALMMIFGTANMASASFTVYTVQSDWETAVGSWLTENFNDGSLNYGINGIASDFGGSIGSGVWYDRVIPGTSPGGPATTSITFNPNIYAFGGTWDLAGPGGIGTNIAVSYDGTDVGQILGTTSGTFWGFVADTTFSSVLLAAGNSSENASAVQETYTLDNMVYSGKAPEPAMLLLFGAGLLGLGLLRKFKQ